MIAKRQFLVAMLPAALATMPATSAEDTPGVMVTPVTSAMTTATGQPLHLPAGAVRVVAALYDIKVGVRLPVHKHPHPRYAYVLEGRLRVMNTQTGQSADYGRGAFVIEAVDQWHYGEALGDAPVRLLVIDQVPEGATGNTVTR